jgi:broad specificity phosphatase PhoE
MNSLPKTRIYLVRHGETESNAIGRWQGWLDSPLTPKGITQAEALSAKIKELDVSFFYTSSSGRAIETAKLLRKDLEWSTSDDLREICLGEFEGLTKEEAKVLAPQKIKDFYEKPSQYSPLGHGETFFQLQERTEKVINAIATKHLGQSIVIVSHGCFIKIFCALVTSIPMDEIWSAAPSIDNGSCLIFEGIPGEWAIAGAIGS